eukprot:m.126515 g.126515  ORF g.126515 m.126515 type:complete len:77 (+) comp15774_c0_seq10:3023-3253(+)
MASRRRQKAGKGLGSALMKNQPHRHPTNRKTASSAVKTASVVVVSASDGLVQGMTILAVDGMGYGSPGSTRCFFCI